MDIKGLSINSPMRFSLSVVQKEATPATTKVSLPQAKAPLTIIELIDSDPLLNSNPPQIPSVQFRYDATGSELDIVNLTDIHKRVKQVSPSPDSPHRLAFNILIFIDQGEGRHLVDFEGVNFKANSVLLLRKGQVQAFDFTDRPSGTAILYTESFLDTLTANVRIPFQLNTNLLKGFRPHLLLSSPIKQRTNRLIQELSLENRRAGPDPSIIMSLFGALLMMLARERESPIQNLRLIEAQKYSTFLKSIEQNYHKSRDASFYADTLNMTYKTLNLLCKKATGKTAKHHIDQCIILEAKRRLAIDRYEIATLAFQLGFDEPTNFTKYFKRHTEMTPKQFIDSMANQDNAQNLSSQSVRN